MSSFSGRSAGWREGSGGAVVRILGGGVVWRGVVLVLLVFVLGLFGVVGVAGAVVPVARWGLESFAYPSDFSVGDTAGCFPESNSYFNNCDSYVVSVTDVGGKAVTVEPIKIVDTLPVGVAA